MAVVNVGRGSYELLTKTVLELALKYNDDVSAVAAFPVVDFFEFVSRGVPYIAETKEIIKRPRLTIQSGGDCDDKTVLVLAYAIKNKIPARVVLAGKKDTPEKFHHIFPELYINGKWITFDATYKWCRLGERMNSYDNFKIVYEVR
ncbi:MAG TPA: transglutaminase domain-containing protein [Spirochaetota bacterium]|jgi:transglutaminase-like putative cysteine protease|nr:transglutaminase domain-containing protein [Spirochaetota bacterium]HOH36107.1 transglutaminase domain-containing protein [Spirochaetota bacterium]HPY01736.1 transglutaminase domain-containing protein [Spirochaetota bacterium]HQA52383.1 transglutaminase domain-containing protein [Spirochaetota bacterium]